MSLLKDYRNEIDSLFGRVNNLYNELIHQRKISLSHYLRFSPLKVEINPKDCYRFNKVDLTRMDMLIENWIKLINFGIENDYRGILQNYQIGLINSISLLGCRFFYPIKDKRLKNELIKAMHAVDKYAGSELVNVEVKAPKKMRADLFNKLEGVYNNIRKGDFTHSVYLHNALLEFNIFDQEKYYRAFDEGIFNKKKI